MNPNWQPPRDGRSDDFPEEVLWAICEQSSPVDAYALVKVVYPRLERFWTEHGTRLTDDWLEKVTHDTNAIRLGGYSTHYNPSHPIIPFSTWTWTWVLKSSVLRTRMWCKRARENQWYTSLDNITEYAGHRPEHSGVKWQTNFWNWMEQTFAFHMESRHAGQSAMDVLQCIRTCRHTSILLETLDVHGNRITHANWNPYIATKINSGFFQPGLGPMFPRGVDEHVFLMEEDLDLLVKNIAMRSLCRAWSTRSQIVYPNVQVYRKAYLEGFIAAGLDCLQKLSMTTPYESLLREETSLARAYLAALQTQEDSHMHIIAFSRGAPDLTDIEHLIQPWWMNRHDLESCILRRTGHCWMTHSDMKHKNCWTGWRRFLNSPAADSYRR